MRRPPAGGRSPATGLLVAWRGTRWPVMSSRYDRPASGKPSAAADPASLWESLSQGLDPTDSGSPAAGPGSTPGVPAAASGGAAAAPGGSLADQAVTDQAARRLAAATARVSLESTSASGGEGVGAGAPPGGARSTRVQLVSRLLMACARGAGPSPAVGVLREPGPGDGELGQA